MKYGLVLDNTGGDDSEERVKGMRVVLGPYARIFIRTHEIVAYDGSKCDLLAQEDDGDYYVARERLPKRCYQWFSEVEVIPWKQKKKK